MRRAAIAYRRFLRACRVFHRWLPWLWFAGCGLCVLVGMLGLGKTWIGAVCAFTIYPCIMGWLFFNGVGILLPLLHHLQKRRAAMERRAWLFIGPFLLVGVLFTAFSAWFLFGLLREFAR